MNSTDNNGAGTNMNDPFIDENSTKSTRELSVKDERMWATLAHLGIIAGLIIPSGSVVAPLVIWLVFKDRSEYVNYHAKEALNFQITMFIAFIVAAILIFVLIGIPALIALAIADLVYSIIAATKANEGEYYKYPYTYRFIK